MLKFEWNALRAGHKVVVHDPASAAMALISGVVVMLDAHVAPEGANRVGIQYSDRPSSVLWPSYLSVHHDPPDPTEPCWRCQELAGGSAGVPTSSQRRHSALPTPRISASPEEVRASRPVPSAS